MKRVFQVSMLGVALMSGACSSIIEGTSQEIMVNTNPNGAKCVFNREGGVIGTIDTTPAALTVKKTKDDITVVCSKEGYQDASYLNHSGAAGATFGNIILGGGIGWAIDSASGADNKYDTPINITLVPKPQPVTSNTKPAVPAAPSAPLTN